jgi:hypothetical protein
VVLGHREQFVAGKAASLGLAPSAAVASVSAGGAAATASRSR